MKTSNILKFVLDSHIVEIDFSKTNYRPSTTVLNYLRNTPGHRGTKEGCAEGDCGACTVVLGELSNDNKIHYKAVDSCMLFLGSIHGKQLITVENLAQRNGSETTLHPVQVAMIQDHGSQCGFCTPGIVMSLFAFHKSNLEPTRENVINALSGNLCRCTGYESILKAAKATASLRQPDYFDVNEPKIIELLSSIKPKDDALEITHSKQKYFLPANLNAAVHFKSQFPTCSVINGATDTAIKQNKKHEFLTEILDLSSVDELKGICETNEGFYIGAGTSIESLKSFAESKIPELNPMLSVFASQQIRNVATIGGNLCTSSPIGDLIPLMFALKAKFEIVSKNGNRWVNSEEFITGYRKNCLQINELLKGIFIPFLGSGVIFKTEKVSNRKDLDISTVSIAARVQLDSNNLVSDIILAYGGMAEVTKRAKHVEQFFLGKSWTLDTAKSAKELIANDFMPISDARAEKEYRKLVAENLLIKLFT